jgi:hypothetical protein
MPDNEITAKDALLYARALKSRWNVPPELRQSIISKLAWFVENGGRERTQLEAIKALMAACQQDILAEVQQIKLSRNQQAQPQQVQLYKLEQWEAPKELPASPIALPEGDTEGSK